MKPTRPILLAMACLGLCLPSCQSTGGPDKAQLARIGAVALDVAERSGKITPAEAALAREAGMILLAPEPAPAPVEATAGK